MKPTRTPGGKRLRALREFHGQTQLDVELDASLGIGYLQRLELGRVQQPEYDTLDRILSALNARYTERKEILELFGYVVDAPLPDEDEIQWAISVCQDELARAMFPAYLLDCAHRLIYWNPLVPNVLEFSSATPDFFERPSMLRVVFDPAYPMHARIKNPADFFPAQIRAFRYEMQRFHDESWCDALLEDMLTCEAFKHHWSHERQQAVHIPARPLTLLELEVGGMLLRFRLISETFVQDQRFRVIFYLPADTATTQHCLEWLKDRATVR